MENVLEKGRGMLHFRASLWRVLKAVLQDPAAHMVFFTRTYNLGSAGLNCSSDLGVQRPCSKFTECELEIVHILALKNYFATLTLLDCHLCSVCVFPH